MTVRRENYAEITLELIESKCIDDGGCWIWQYGTAHDAPYMSHNKKSVSVRRWIAANVLGENIRGRFVTAKCMNKLCVCPDHTIVVTRHRLQQMWSDHLQYAQNPVRRQKLVEAAKQRFGYDQELIERIMADDRPQRTIAAEIGKSQDFVSKIKNGRHFKTADNPFIGLMR
jgi:hypothetical protein